MEFRGNWSVVYNVLFKPINGNDTYDNDVCEQLRSRILSGLVIYSRLGLFWYGYDTD